MTLRTLGPKVAADLDAELMSSSGGFSIDQLMELAGLSVSQAVYRMLPPTSSSISASPSTGSTSNTARNGSVSSTAPSSPHRILVACGPGNNGGDGLVAARHLHHYGYECSVYYPKQSKNELYQRLRTQLENLSISFVDDLPEAFASADLVLDAIFGFSFSGEVREPFPAAIEALAQADVEKEKKKPVLAVDAPSSWHIEDGPPNEGPGKAYQPAALISLTAPKPLVKYFEGRHFVGGRFLSVETAKKYGLDVPEYRGVDQIAEVPARL